MQHYSIADAKSVFTFLAVSVHDTYPGTTIKYTPGGPIFTYYTNSYVEPGIYLNGSTFFENNLDPLNVRLLEAAKFGPTVLPIPFAEIVWSALRLLASWRVEIGSTLEVKIPANSAPVPQKTIIRICDLLEILVGSTSLASRVSTLFSLRAIGAVELSLFCYGQFFLSQARHLCRFWVSRMLEMRPRNFFGSD
jgi:hypothetical protein